MHARVEVAISHGVSSCPSLPVRACDGVCVFITFDDRDCLGLRWTGMVHTCQPGQKVM